MFKLLLVAIVFFSPIFSFAVVPQRTNASIRMMTQMRQGPPGRCSVTRIGKVTLATAGHCVFSALRPFTQGAIRINTELAGVWLNVLAHINPDYAMYESLNQTPSDTAVLILAEEDEKYLEGIATYPPCDKVPTLEDKLIGSSQWFGSRFEGKLEPLDAINYLRYFPVIAEAHQRFLGVIEEESGGALLMKNAAGQLCWLGSLSAKAASLDFSLRATYSGIDALNWVRSLVR